MKTNRQCGWRVFNSTCKIENRKEYNTPGRSSVRDNQKNERVSQCAVLFFSVLVHTLWALRRSRAASWWWQQQQLFGKSELKSAD